MKLISFSPRRAACLAALALLASSGAHAQRVVRDAQTGQLRAPNARESKALESKPSPAVGLLTGRINPQPEVYADGTVGQELDSSSLMYSVATRNADGSISQYCVKGNDAAERLVKGAKAGGRSTQVSKASQASKGAAYEVK